MTSCLGRCGHESTSTSPVVGRAGSGARIGAAVLQSGEGAGGGRELRAVGGTSGERKSQPYRLFGSAAGDGERGTRPARHRAPAARCQAAADEDAGGVRVRASAADTGGEDSRTGRRWVHHAG